MCPHLGKIVRSFTVIVQRGGRDQLADVLLMVGGEVMGRQHQQPPGSNQSGVHVLAVNSFHLEGVCFL